MHSALRRPLLASPRHSGAPYWQGLEEGRLRLPRCAQCEHDQWPVVARCGTCGHWGSIWRDLPLTGTIFSWTRAWHPFGGTEGLPRPFVSLLAEIEDAGGTRLMGLLEGVDDKDHVPIGAAVAGRIGQTSYGDEDVPVIIWRLVD